MAPDDGDGVQDFYLLCRVNGVTNGRTRNSSANGKLSRALLFPFSVSLSAARAYTVSSLCISCTFPPFLVNLSDLLSVVFFFRSLCLRYGMSFSSSLSLYFCAFSLTIIFVRTHERNNMIHMIFLHVYNNIRIIHKFVSNFIVDNL